MSINDIVQYLGEGGVLVFLLLMLIEIAPIQINPIGWLGERFNKKIAEKDEEFRKDMTKKVDSINNKLDAHIAEDYRNSILKYQDRLLRRETFTREEWKKAFDLCADYEKYIKDNNLTNDQVNEAMNFIKRSYRRCLDEGNFTVLPYSSMD